jgi:hypothetical protein
MGKQEREPQVLMKAAPYGRPRAHVYVLYDNGKVIRKGHFFNPGKPDPRTDVEYQAFGALHPTELEAKFREWAKRCDFEVLN